MAAVVSVVEPGADAVVAGDSVAAQSIRLVLAIGSGLARWPAPPDCWRSPNSAKPRRWCARAWLGWRDA